MTYEKWTGKASEMADEMLNAGAKYDYDYTGAVIAEDRGRWALWLEGQEILSADGGKKRVNGLVRIVNDAIRDTVCAAATPEKGRTGDGIAASRLTSGRDTEFWPVVKNSLLRKFPSNSTFYTFGRHKPVLVALEDKRGAFHIIGVVMPVRYEQFTPAN